MEEVMVVSCFILYRKCHVKPEKKFWVWKKKLREKIHVLPWRPSALNHSGIFFLFHNVKLTAYNTLTHTRTPLYLWYAHNEIYYPILKSIVGSKKSSTFTFLHLKGCTFAFSLQKHHNITHKPTCKNTSWESIRLTLSISIIIYSFR